MKKQWKRWLVVGVAVVALSGLAVGVVSAHGGGWLGRPDGDSYLAEELGITVDELTAARERAQDKALQQALEEGLITEEQYEMYQVRAALQPYLDRETLTATALGIDVEELGDKTLEEWLDELGLDRETFVEAMQAAREAAIQQAIDDGVITQEQADALDTLGRGCDGFHGRGGPMGGRGGRMRGLPEGASGDEATLEGSSFRMQRFAPSDSF